jgi:hypothetical protein
MAWDRPGWGTIDRPGWGVTDRPGWGVTDRPGWGEDDRPRWPLGSEEPPVAGTSMLVSFSPGTYIRTDAWWAGMFVTPDAAFTITALGCFVVPGNSGDAVVALVEQTGGTITAQAVIDQSLPPDANGFVYTPISPVTVVAGQLYAFVANTSTMAGWHDQSPAVLTADWAAGVGAYMLVSDDPSGIYSDQSPVGGMWVGVDLKYH